MLLFHMTIKHLTILSISVIFMSFMSDFPIYFSKMTPLSNTVIFSRKRPLCDEKNVIQDINAWNTLLHVDSCIDLAFDTVKIVALTDKYVEIDYSIINKGTIAAPLFGKKKTKRDNVSVHFYFSGTPRLSRGSILGDGIYLTEGLKDTRGMLAPNAIYTQRFRLLLKKKLQYYGVIILQLDALDILPLECDETNNTKAIIPKWY